MSCLSSLVKAQECIVSFSPYIAYLKFAKIIASDSVMTSLKCHTMVFASNCLFILPPELAGHALAYAFVYNNDFQLIEENCHLKHCKNTRIKAIPISDVCHVTRIDMTIKK